MYFFRIEIILFKYSLQKQAVMQLIGGDTSQIIVSNILSYTMTYELGHKVSWTGAKGSIAIKDSPFINTIIGE